MPLKDELLAALRRVLPAALTFLTSLVMAAALVVSGILLELLIGFAVGYDTLAYQIVGFVLDTTMVICALVWAVTGAIVATWEAVISAITFVRRTRE